MGLRLGQQGTVACRLWVEIDNGSETNDEWRLPSDHCPPVTWTLHRFLEPTLRPIESEADRLKPRRTNNHPSSSEIDCMRLPNQSRAACAIARPNGAQRDMLGGTNEPGRSGEDRPHRITKSPNAFPDRLAPTISADRLTRNQD